MRHRHRAAAFLALAIVAITCTDAPTKPSSAAAGRLRLSPSFSSDAARAYSALAAFGLEVTEVRVRLTAPDGTIRDTVIAFPANADSLVIEIPVPSSSTDQPFTALLELRNDQHTVLFSGTQQVVARTAGLPRLSPAVVIIQYTGPGRGARTITLSPPDTTVIGAVSVPFRATAVDSGGAAISNLLVRWVTSDATLATVASTGDAAAAASSVGRRGTVTLTAITPQGVSGSTRFNIVPPAARVVVISGGNQTAIAGSVLAQPLIVEVQATDNLPVPGATVAFRAVTAGGTVQTATAVTDATGRASTNLTLGRTGGVYEYEVTSPLLPAVTVNETATPAPPTLIEIVSGNGQVDSAGRVLPLPLVVKVTDQYGGPVNAATVNWTRVAGTGTTSSPSTLTGVDGFATVNYTMGSVVSNDTVRANVTGLTTPAGSVLFSMRSVSRRPASIAIISGSGQRGTPGSTLPGPLVALVVDQFSNPVVDAPVAWNGSTGTTFTPQIGTTSSNGQFSTSVRLGLTAGLVTVTANTGALVAAASLTITPGTAAAIAKNAGDGQSATVGTTLPVAPSVIVRDASGNPVAGAGVVFAVASGGGTASGLSSTTNAAGIATVGSWTLGNTTGANTLTASVGNIVTTFTATATAGSASKFALASAIPTSIVVGATPPTVRVQVTDAAGNPSATAGVVVTATAVVQPGAITAAQTATTDAAGIATFVGAPYIGPLGAATITLSAPGFTSLTTGSIPVVVGAAAKLMIATQPASTGTSGAVLAPQPVIQVADAGSNPVSSAGVSIVAAIASGGGSLGGTAAVATAATGLAAFTDLSIAGAAGARTLQFSSAGLLSVTSNAVTLSVGTPTAMLKNAGDAQTATAGTAVAVAPSVIVRDAGNTPVPGVAVTFAVATGGGSATGLTTTTNGAGIATVGSWTLGSTAGANSLTATAGALSVTFTATGTSGSATKFAIVQALPTSITVGAAIGTATVQLTDALNNPVAQAGVSVTATGTVQPSAATFALTGTTDAAGVATFSLPPYVGPTGTATFTLTASGITSFTSSSIPVVAGVAAKLLISTQPAATAASGAPLSPQPVVQVADVGSNPVTTAGVAVVATIASGGGTLGGTTTVASSATGQATFTDLSISGTTGTRTLTFTSGALTPATSGGISIGVGAATTIALNAGSGQSATAGSAVSVPPSVKVSDAAGNPVSGALVTFGVITAGGQISDGTTTGTTLSVNTNPAGIAALASWTLSPTAGSNSMNATAGTLAGSPVAFTATGTAGSASKFTLASTLPSSITVGGGATTLAFQLRDALNNAVAQAGVTVTATRTVLPSNAVTAFTATSDAAGVATFNIPSYVGPIGTFSVAASAAGVTTFTTSSVSIVTGAATTFSIATQASTTAASGVPFATQPVIQIEDAGGNPVSQSGVSVSVSIATGGGTLSGTTPIVTNGSGQAAFTDLAISGTAGTRRLSFAAFSHALTSGSISVGAGVASNMGLNAGNGQSATVGTAVAIAPSVRITDASGNPVSGVVVTFTAVTSGSQVSNGTTTGTSVTVTSATSGIAALTSWTLGTTAQSYTLTATASVANGSPTTFTATATPGAASKFLLTSTLPTSITVAGAAPPAITVRLADASNNPVSQAGVSVTGVTTVSPSGQTATYAVTTDAAGVATFSQPPYVGQIGTMTLAISSSGIATFTTTGIPVVTGSAAALTIATQPPTAAVSGVAFSPQPVVQLVDAGTNPVSTAGVPVGAAIATGAGTLSGTSPISTNGAGRAVFTDLYIRGTVGARTLSFTSTGLTGATSSTVNVSAGAAASIAKNTGDAQSATVGTSVTIAPSVFVADAAGNPVAGAPVTFAVAGGGGSGTGLTTTTNSLGIATVGSWTLGSAPGANTLTATTGAFTTTFSATATVGSATHFQLTSTLPTSLTVGASPAFTITVRLADALNNPVSQSGVVVTGTATVSPTGAVAAYTATTDAAGVATFNIPAYVGPSGSVVFTAAASGLTTYTSASIPIATGAAAALAMAQQPGGTVASGALLSPQPILQLVDQGSNPVASAGVVVNVVIATGGGTLGGTTSATTNSAGQAAFTNLTLSGTVGGRTFTFSSGALTAVTSGTVTVSAGPLATVTVTPNPATVAAAATQQFSAAGTDAQGNPVAITPTWSVVSGGGTISASGLFTAGATPGTYSNTVRATSGAVSGTATVNVTVGPLATITVTPNPATVGAGTTRQFTAVGKDASNNVVTITPTWSVTSGGGTVDAAGLFTAGTTLGTFANTVRAQQGGVFGTATVDVSASTFTALQSGPWSSGSTWVGGVVPVSGASIVIPNGIAVGADVAATVRDLTVQGYGTLQGTSAFSVNGTLSDSTGGFRPGAISFNVSATPIGARTYYLTLYSTRSAVGAITFNGTNARLLDNLYISDSVSLNGSTGARLALNGHLLQAAAALTVTTGATLDVSNPADTLSGYTNVTMSGGTLLLGGVLTVSNNADLSGDVVNILSTGRLMTWNDLVLGKAGGTLNAAAGSYIGGYYGNTSFFGDGTLSADTVDVYNASFGSDTLALPRGTLLVRGYAFDVATGGRGRFVAKNDHVTAFGNASGYSEARTPGAAPRAPSVRGRPAPVAAARVPLSASRTRTAASGYADAHINLGTTTNQQFARVKIQPYAGLQVNGAAVIVAGPDSLRLDADYSSYITVKGGSSLTVNGATLLNSASLYVETNAAFISATAWYVTMFGYGVINIQGSYTGLCSLGGSTYTDLTGTGTFNGSATFNKSSCRASP